jgi:hypothetical protein
MQNLATTNALSIIANPHHTHPPSLRMLAWAVLKSERGQTLHQSGLRAAVIHHFQKSGRAQIIPHGFAPDTDGAA